MTNEIRAGHEKANLVFGREIRMKDDLTPLVETIASIDKPILFFNIGTDRVTGDSFGPMLGTMLIEHRADELFDDVAILGTLDDPINAVNLADRLEEAKKLYKDHVWIATDACLGRAENIGTITLSEGMLTPGAGVNKMLPPVGDYALTPVVNVGGFMEFFVLQNTRLNLIYSLARRTADAIIAGLDKRQKRRESIESNEYALVEGGW